MKCHNVEFQNPSVCGGLKKSTLIFHDRFESNVIRSSLAQLSKMPTYLKTFWKHPTSNISHPFPPVLSPGKKNHASQQTPWAKAPQHGLSFHTNSRTPWLLLNRSLSASKSGAVSDTVSDIATSPTANSKSLKVSKTILFKCVYICLLELGGMCVVMLFWWPWQLLHVEAIKSIKLCCFVSYIYSRKNMKRFTDSRHSAISPHMLAQTQKSQSNVCLGPLIQFQCNCKLFFSRCFLVLPFL